MKTHYSRQSRMIRIIGNYGDDKPLMDEIAEARAKECPVRVEVEDERYCGMVKEFDPTFDLAKGQPVWMAVLEDVREAD